MNMLETLGAGAIILTAIGYWLNRAILTIASDIIWLLFSLQAYSMSTQDWTNWDIYLALFFFGIFFMLGTGLESLWQRINHPKAQQVQDELWANKQEKPEVPMSKIEALRAKHGLPPKRQFQNTNDVFFK